MSDGHSINPWVPYSNDVIDVNDPAITEFYETFGSGQVDHPAPSTPTLAFDGPNQPPQTFPIIAQQQIDAAPNVSDAPQLVQDPSLYFPEEEHAWGYLPHALHASTSPCDCTTVDPSFIMLDSYVDPLADVPNNEAGPSPQPEPAPAPAPAPVPRPETPVELLSERGKRARRRALLKEEAEKKRILSRK